MASVFSKDRRPAWASELSQSVQNLAGRLECIEAGTASRLAELHDLVLHAERAALQTQQELADLRKALSGTLDGFDIDRLQPDFALIHRKLDVLAGDTTTREDSMRVQIDMYGAAFEHRFSLLSKRISALEARLKPPAIHASENILVTEIDGFILGIPSEEWRLGAYYIFRGLLEPGLMKAFQQAVRPGMTIVDIGANIGIYTLHGARLAGETGKVYSFEPAPRIFEILRDNVQVNGLRESGRIVLHPVALAETSGSTEFHVYRNDSGHNTMFPDGRTCDTIVVPTAALDDELPAGTRVDVVKMDAEGAEPLIWRGMTRVLFENPDIRIFMEFAPVHLARAGVEPRGFLYSITQRGFHIARVDDLTGELLPAGAEELAAAESVNLSISRGIPAWKGVQKL